MERKSVELDAKQKEMRNWKEHKGRNKCPDPDFLFWNAVPYNMAASAGGDRI